MTILAACLLAITIAIHVWHMANIDLNINPTVSYFLLTRLLEAFQRLLELFLVYGLLQLSGLIPKA